MLEAIRKPNLSNPRDKQFGCKATQTMNLTYNDLLLVLPDSFPLCSPTVTLLHVWQESQ